MGEVIYEDTRQQVARGDKHAAKHAWWAAHGIDVVRVKLDFGDYARDGSNIAVDTKKGLVEVAADVGREHARFARECDRARDAGWRLVVLVEESRRFGSVRDVAGWMNAACLRCPQRRGRACDPRSQSSCLRYRRKPMQGVQVARTMASMEGAHGFRWQFCEPGDAARSICEILGVTWT